MKKSSCQKYCEQKKRIETPNHFAVIDYGDRTWYRIATILIDEGPPGTILPS